MEEQIQLLNMVANQPEVLSGSCPPRILRLNLADFFLNPDNIMLGDARGLVLFMPLGSAIWEVHFLLTSSLRGPKALHAIRTAFGALFTWRDAICITGAIPRENRASRAMVRALGCRPIGVSTDTHGRDCINYIMERKTWVTLSGV